MYPQEVFDSVRANVTSIYELDTKTVIVETAALDALSNTMPSITSIDTKAPLVATSTEEVMQIGRAFITSLATFTPLVTLDVSPEEGYLHTSQISLIDLRVALVAYTTATPEPVNLAVSSITSIQLS